MCIPHSGPVIVKTAHNRERRLQDRKYNQSSSVAVVHHDQLFYSYSSFNYTCAKAKSQTVFKLLRVGTR
jgi:hypothetical protein